MGPCPAANRTGASVPATAELPVGVRIRVARYFSAPGVLAETGCGHPT